MKEETLFFCVLWQYEQPEADVESCSGSGENETRQRTRNAEIESAKMRLLVLRSFLGKEEVKKTGRKKKKKRRIKGERKTRDELEMEMRAG